MGSGNNKKGGELGKTVPILGYWAVFGLDSRLRGNDKKRAGMTKYKVRWAGFPSARE